MLYKKEGFPEDSEIVLCTVLEVQHNTIFVLLDEYSRKGVIHISEISPGRIRNIRDFVVEGKKVICKVLRINQERGHIDLSLRRVTETQKREKNNIIKQEQKAEKILELVCKESKCDLKEIYNRIKLAAFQRYHTLFSCFEDIVAGNFSVSELKLDSKMSKALEELIRTRIKPPEVEIKGILKTESYEPDGVEVIKEAIRKGRQDNITISYAGAGRFNMSIKAEDYKTAENMLKKSVDAIANYMKERRSKAEFARDAA